MTSIDKNKISKLYNNRFIEHGRSYKTVGWGDKETQIKRFDVLLSDVTLKGKKILDVGCGLGDLIPYLDSKTGGDFDYYGIDIAEDLIKDAVDNYGSSLRQFIKGDVFDKSLPVVDIVVVSGAFSFNTPGMKDYAIAAMKRMYELSSEVVAINFLTTFVDYEADINQHYNPSDMLTEALNVTRKVRLYHDYPLYEFTIQLFKEGTEVR